MGEHWEKRDCRLYGYEIWYAVVMYVNDGVVTTFQCNTIVSAVN